MAARTTHSVSSPAVRSRRTIADDDRPDSLWDMERSLRRRGFEVVAGADEAGRGACAGPLVAAAAILPEGRRGEIDGLTDSKLLTPAARERIYAAVVDCALAYSIIAVPATEVDSRGLHVCNVAAMRRALASLAARPDYVLTDGFGVDGLGVPGLAVWKGDQVAACVAAASVLAKVTRDRIMVELDARFPSYGFALHKGYVTEEHSTALRQHGPCPEHRFSYINVATASGRDNRPPRVRRPAPPEVEPLMPWPVPGGTVGVASGEGARPPLPVGEDGAMEGEKR